MLTTCFVTPLEREQGGDTAWPRFHQHHAVPIESCSAVASNELLSRCMSHRRCNERTRTSAIAILFCVAQWMATLNNCSSTVYWEGKTTSGTHPLSSLYPWLCCCCCRRFGRSSVNRSSTTVCGLVRALHYTVDVQKGHLDREHLLSIDPMPLLLAL